MPLHFVPKVQEFFFNRKININDYKLTLMPKNQICR
jgi:hypothetical protein